MQVSLPGPAVDAEARGLLVRAQLGLLKLYKRFLSPMIAPACRFHPTCSVYAMEALEKYGWLKANMKIAWRLLRCAPWCQGGHDPA